MNADGTTTGYSEWHYVPFNKDYTDWQYASGVIIPKQEKAVNGIQVYAFYTSNANTAYFDNIHHGIMIYLPHIDTSNLERKGKMIPTNKAFDRKTEIIYDGKLYSRIYKVISEPGEYRLHFEFISTDSEYEQYIGLSMYCFKGKASIGGERVKLGRGTFTGMRFLEKITPKQFDVDVILESGTVSVFNDVTGWKEDITFKTPSVMPAMIVEKISDNSYIFHCNDRVYDDDFDDLVFSLEITKLE